MTTRVAAALEGIEKAIAAKHLLTHPFYQAWTRGELTKEALQDYAQQYYQHVAAFPTYLSAVHAKTEDQQVRKHLLQNLMDEEAGTPNHPELWLQFTDALGLDRQEVQSAERWSETDGVINTFRSICNSEIPAEGIAALYAYESQIPAVSTSKIDGLKKFYGFNEQRDFEYFSVHIEADKEHARVERELLAQLFGGLALSSELNRIQASVEKVLDALWELLSGVCRRHNICCSCEAAA